MFCWRSECVPSPRAVVVMSEGLGAVLLREIGMGTVSKGDLLLVSGHGELGGMP